MRWRSEEFKVSARRWAGCSAKAGSAMPKTDRGGCWPRKSMFFFEKKNQKTFPSLGRAFPAEAEAKHAKVFWFFFSKKNCFLPEET
jgi:hypothetical protein